MSDQPGPIPLLNRYKHVLLRRRLLSVITGGLNIRRAPWPLHLFQLLLWFLPFLLCIPFVIVDALRLWNQYYTALVYGVAMGLYSLALELLVVALRHRKGGLFTGTQYDDEQDDTIKIKSILDRVGTDFIFSIKRVHSLIIHPFIVGLLSFASCFLLLPTVLLESLPVAGVVVVFIMGWYTVCSTSYSICVRAPSEVAVHRPTDPLELRFIMRPLYILILAAFFITIRVLVTAPGVYLTVLYSLLCALPLAWMVGLLPPPDALLSWVLEQALVRLLGGSSSATDLRLLVQFFLSCLAVVVVSAISDQTLSLLLSTAFGFVLSQNIFHTASSLLCALLSLCPAVRAKLEAHCNSYKTFVSVTGIDCHRMRQLKLSILYWAFSSVRSALLLGIGLVVVYLTFTVTDGAARVLVMNIIGGLILGTYVLMRVSNGLQKVYLFRVFRNPLFPWTCDHWAKFKTKRKMLQYFATPRALGITYVVPFLLLAYTGLSVTSELSLVPSVWAWIAISRLLRMVWQNTVIAHRGLFLVVLLHFIIPQLDTALTFGVFTQALVFGEVLTILIDFKDKILFAGTLFFRFVANKKHRTYKLLTISIIVGTILLLPLVLLVVLLSSILATSLLPVFTLPIFFVSFPRPRRFWPALLSFGKEYTKCADSVYYQQCRDEIVMAVHRSMSSGAVSSQPGTQLLVRFDDKTIFCSILEAGYAFKTLTLKGLELQETSCHTVEASKIDEIFESVYDPSTIGCCKFFFNTHLMSSLQPRDSAVIRTYSDAKNVLTGIIDQSSSLEKFSTNLLKTLVWVLFHHYRKYAGSTGIASPLVTVRAEETALNEDPPRLTEEKPLGTTDPNQDDQSWDSVSTIDDNDLPRPIRPIRLGSDTSIPSLIPLDRPTSTRESTDYQGKIEDIFVSPSEVNLPSLPMSRSTTVPTSQGCRSPKVQPLIECQIPEKWSNVPVSSTHVSKLLRDFPSEWYRFTRNLPNNAHFELEPEKERQLRILVMICFNLVDIPTVTNGRQPTASFDVYQGFVGEFPYSTHLSWLTQDTLLKSLVLRAYRYAVKVMYDEASLGELESLSELAKCLEELDSGYFIGSESESGWEQSILEQVPHLFSMARDQEKNVYTAHVLTLQDQLVHIGELNQEAVKGVWSDLSLELLFLTNDDDERYSIQAHSGILRNLTIQAADPPLGYSVYSSSLLRIPTV